MCQVSGAEECTHDGIVRGPQHSGKLRPQCVPVLLQEPCRVIHHLHRGTHPPICGITGVTTAAKTLTGPA